MTDSIIYTVIASLIALGVVFTLHAIYRPKSLKIAILMIFLSISTPLALYKPFIASLGFSVHQGNNQHEVFISYTVDAEQEWIYMWVMDKDANEPRAYKTPYSKEKEKAMNEAQEKGEKGIEQEVLIPPPMPGANDTQAEIEVQDRYNVVPGGVKS
jgi:hypothetical protein